MAHNPPAYQPAQLDLNQMIAQINSHIGSLIVHIIQDKDASVIIIIQHAIHCAQKTPIYIFYHLFQNTVYIYTNVCKEL